MCNWSAESLGGLFLIVCIGLALVIAAWRSE